MREERAPAPEPTRATTPRVVLPTPAPLPTVTAVAPANDPLHPPAPPPGVATQDEQPGSEAWTAGWWIGLALAVLAIAAVAVWRWRVGERRHAATLNTRIPTGPMPPAPPPEPGEVARFWTPAAPRRNAEPAAPAQAPAAPRARLVVGLVAHRAGLNLVSATAEVEVEVRNEGEGEGAAISVALHLLGASAGQDSALGSLFAAPPTRPVTPPFTLAPGEARTVRATLSIARAAIVPLAAGNRQMFVPVVAVDVRYGLPDGGQGQTAAAFMIGATRADGDKLAPFWLDAPPRTLDQVAARPHALSIAS